MMAAARFSAGQCLHLLQDLRLSKVRAEGLYTVVRVMPNEGRELCYRIKHDAEAFDRMVAESQLTEPERNQDEPAQISRQSKARP
jgi:hypothetical protein